VLCYDERWGGVGMSWEVNLLALRLWDDYAGNVCDAKDFVGLWNY